MGDLKTLPYSAESEQAVLCAMLLNAEHIDTVSEKVSEPDFYVPKHRIIFRNILSLRQQTDVIDSLTLSEEIKRNGDEDKIQNRYLLDLYDASYSAANLGYHIENLIGKAILRNLIDRCHEVVYKVNQNGADPNEIADEAEAKIISVRDKYIKDDLMDSKTVLIETLKELSSFKDHESPAIPTPWKDLNRITLGFFPGELTILAARPGAGKTSMAVNMAEFLTMDMKIPALFFSIEMKPTQLQSRIICSRLNISLHKIRDGSLAAGDWVRIGDIENDIAETPLIFDGSTRLTINEIRGKSRRALKRYGAKIVFVDYIQKITGPKSETREREMSFISGQLKELARELNIPVVALCQLSRAIEQRGDDPIPKLSDLRESGAIEQDADVVMFLYSKFEKEKRAFNPVTTVLVLKQRHGPPGHCQLYFEKRITKFQSTSQRELEE